MDRDEMSKLYRGPPIDASYQVLVHLAKWFQRRRLLKIGQSETRIACGSHYSSYNTPHICPCKVSPDSIMHQVIL
jgi:hypothetical protein